MSGAYDVIVIGAGGIGSAACYQLAARGARVLALEQYSLVHDRGSSHGDSRIIRQAYFEHPDYVPLLLETYRLWKDLERTTGQHLFDPVGLLMSGVPTGPTIGGARMSAHQYGLPLDDMSADEARQRWPQFRFPDAHRVLFEPAAGLLHVEDCVRAHLDAARACGAAIHAEEPALHWSADGSTVRVRTSRGDYTAGALVVTAGAWSQRFLAAMNLPLRVLRKFVGWFPVDPSAPRPAREMPTYYFELPHGDFYGFPSLDGQTAKLAEHSGGQLIERAEEVDRDLGSNDVAPLAGFVERHLTGVLPTLHHHSVCLYTMSPDQHFIVDRHPEWPHVVFAAGLSGHGFKFAPVLGAALADLSLNGQTELPIGFLSRRRLQSPV